MSKKSTCSRSWNFKFLFAIERVPAEHGVSVPVESGLQVVVSWTWVLVLKSLYERPCHDHLFPALAEACPLSGIFVKIWFQVVSVWWRWPGCALCEVILGSKAKWCASSDISGQVVKFVRSALYVKYVNLIWVLNLGSFGNVYSILAFDSLTGLWQISSQVDIVTDMFLLFVEIVIISISGSPTYLPRGTISCLFENKSSWVWDSFWVSSSVFFGLKTGAFLKLIYIPTLYFWGIYCLFCFGWDWEGQKLDLQINCKFETAKNKTPTLIFNRTVGDCLNQRGNHSKTDYLDMIKISNRKDSELEL